MKDSHVKQLFVLSGSAWVNAAHKHVDEIDPRNRTNVSLSVAIQDLGSFQEISMTFRAKVYIQLKWFDKRLTFANLKKDNDERNSIGKIFSSISFQTDLFDLFKNFIITFIL